MPRMTAFSPASRRRRSRKPQRKPSRLNRLRLWTTKPTTRKPKDEAAAKPDTQKQNDKTAKDPKQAAADQPKKPKPQAKKRDFNPDKIAALLNKIPDAADDPKPVMPDDGTPPKKVKGQTNG